ncbi:hypothetical protein [Aureimonas glaciei]|uniref:Uncharacterized protein n=1 Tax=Aureimonas glaciei TaxID=1776957 RepID=A0A917DDL4_9HYPH|nr:hypothetical protein [Aureimonas glaciei]GGD31446.1 hypothetical protein GCM10011335_38100 [Aureimonas glaciei]
MTHKKIIALDFDGVLHAYTTPWSDAETVSDGPTPGAMEFLRDLTNDGRFQVVVVSSRLNEPSGDIAVQEFIRSNLYAEFGVCKGQVIQAAITFSKTRPPATVCIDDRAWNFQGAWPSLDRLAAFTPWNKKPAHLRPDPESAVAIADSLMMQIGQIAKDAGCPDDEPPLDFIRTRMSPTYKEADGQDWSDEALRLSRKIASDAADEAAGPKDPLVLNEAAKDIITETIKEYPEDWEAVVAGGPIGWFCRHVAVRIGETMEGGYCPYGLHLIVFELERRVAGVRAEIVQQQERISMIGASITHWLFGGDQPLAIERLPRVGGDGVFFEWKVPFRGYQVFMPELAFAGCSTEAEARLVSESYLDAFADGQAHELAKAAG